MDRRHPLEKSLSIFPLVPRSKQSLVSSSLQHENQSTSVSLARRQPQTRRPSQCHQVEVNFPPASAITNVEHPSKDSLRDEFYFNTKRKLDQASKFIPKKNVMIPLKLPPLSSNASSLSSHFTDGQSLNLIATASKERKWKPCTCGRKKTAKDDLSNLKDKHVSGSYQAEETPRLFSVYVRWKTYRDGTSEYDFRTLRDTFQTFGEIVNIVFKTRNSAVIVFTTSDAACTAAKVFMNVGQEMRLYVRWLNDMT